MVLPADEKKDYSEDLKAKIPEATHMAKGGRLTDAVEMLLILEKRCRLANDIPTLIDTCVAIVKLCREMDDWEQLGNNLLVLTKRRAQHSKPIAAIVGEGMKYLAEAPSEDVKLKLIITLRTVTDGRIYVEAERARLTQMLSQIKEREGLIDEACDILQEVHVETYGSLTKFEKAEFILEQVRLTLAKKDFVRTLIQSKKVNRKLLLEDGFEALKLKFYRMMVEYYAHEGEMLELFTCYHSVFSTPSVQEDEAAWKEALSSAIVFLVLAPHDAEHADRMLRLQASEKKRLEKVPVFRDVLQAFITQELAPFPFPEATQAALLAHPALSDKERGPDRLALFHKRLVEHNIRVIAAYYDRLHMGRLGELLSLSPEDTEKHVSELVSSGGVFAKIDRPAGIVSFSPAKQSTEVLSDWAGDLGELLKLVDSTCHLISKERMTHKV